MSTQRTIKIGSRRSRLAIKQVEEVLSLAKTQGIDLRYELVLYETLGDLDKTTPLSGNVPDDFFTDSLDQALLKKEIDLAIHSAKDLPQKKHPGLEIFALTASLDETDSLVAHNKLADLKAGSKIGTSSLMRSQSLKNLNPNTTAVQVRGTIEERLSLFDQNKIDGLIVATCALKRLNLEHLITEIMPWESTPLQGQLAVVGRVEDEELKALCKPLDVRARYGKVVLVGAGPGDPELITLKAIKTLRRANCVFYDYLIDKSLLRYARKAEKIYVGKRKGEHTLPQSELSKMLRQNAMAGKNVVRLKGGDPLIFGRGAEEIEYLRAYHIEVEIIPGISSATGIPSSLGIPLTARGVSSSVAFLSAHGPEESADATQPLEIPKVDTIVFLMGLTRLKLIIQSLNKSGWKKDTPVLIISRGTRWDQKLICGTIEAIEQLVLNQHLEPPALIVIGAVVKFWDTNTSTHFESLDEKTSDERILYLGTHPDKYKLLGQIVHLPMIDIVPVEFTAQQKEQIREELGSYQMVILTSRFAVRYFLKIIREETIRNFLKIIREGTTLPLNARKLDWAVIGGETASLLREYGIQPTIIAALETGPGLVQTLKEKYDLKGKRILFPRSSLPNPYIKEELNRLGACVQELVVYENRKTPFQELPMGGIRKVLFTSPSIVRNFLEAYGEIPGHWQILSRGPSTHQTLKEKGYESEILMKVNDPRRGYV